MPGFWGHVIAFEMTGVKLQEFEDWWGSLGENLDAMNYFQGDTLPKQLSVLLLKDSGTGAVTATLIASYSAPPPPAAAEQLEALWGDSGAGALALLPETPRLGIGTTGKFKQSPVYGGRWIW